ncbi:hypothetical protein Tco_0488598 [Tanacetum coccineum]
MSLRQTYDENDLYTDRMVTGGEYASTIELLNEATRKDHFPLPFIGSIDPKGSGETKFFVSSKAFWGISKLPMDRKDQKRQPILARTVHFAYHRCLLGSMQLQHDTIGPHLAEKPFHGKGALFLGTKISNQELRSDQAKVDVIAKSP